MQVREEKYIQLYKTQDSIIKLVVEENFGFYLTGGTALQRFYFDSYRYSDDLDFFLIDNGTSKADSKEFQKFLDMLDNNNIEYSINISSPYFKQIFLKENHLKIDLVNDFVFHQKDFIKAENGLYLDSLQNIFVNKLETTLSRTEPRDLFDIYTILSNHKIDINKSFKLLGKKTNLEPSAIVENLTNIDTRSINSDKIQVKNAKVLEDFVNNFHNIISHVQDLSLSNKQDLALEKMKQKIESVTKTYKPKSKTLGKDIDKER